MKSIKLEDIKELAQNFLKAPRISTTNNGLYITYDYEMESGDYGEKSVFFEDLKDYKHTDEKDVTSELIEAAYNSVSKVIDSTWLSTDMINEGYHHFIIYFDEYGAFEIIAKRFRFE